MNVSIARVGRRRQQVLQRATCVPKVNLEKKMVLIYVLSAMQVGMRILLVQQLALHALEDRRLKQAPPLVICVPKVNSLQRVIIYVINVSQVSRPMLLDP